MLFSRRFYILTLVLIIFVGFRDGSFLPDYSNYLDLFKSYSESRFSILHFSFNDGLIEPSFQLICFIAYKISDSSIFLFLIYAALSIIIKFKAINELSSLLLYSIFIYLCNFFILHDLIQIRAGVAAGFALLSIKSAFDKDLKAFLIYYILAIFFHQTAIIVGLLFFLDGNKFNKKVWVFIIPLVYLIHFMGFAFSNLIAKIPVDYVQLKYSQYEVLRENSYVFETNIFNTIQLIRILVCYLLIYYYDRIIQYNKYFNILLKSFIVGISSFVLFANYHVYAYRISELFLYSEIILIPLFVKVYPKSIVFRIIPILIGLAFAYINLIYLHLIQKI